MAKVNLKGLLTPTDRRQFLREVYEESVVEQVKNKVDSFSNDEYYAGQCPYCHKPRAVFLNIGKAHFENRELVKARCIDVPPLIQGCGKELYIKVKVRKEGDLLAGYIFTPSLVFYTIEEIHEKYGSPLGITDEDISEQHQIAEKQRKAEWEKRQELLKEEQATTLPEEAPKEEKKDTSDRPRLLGFRVR